MSYDVCMFFSVCFVSLREDPGDSGLCALPSSRFNGLHCHYCYYCYCYVYLSLLLSLLILLLLLFIVSLSLFINYY